MKIYLVRHQLQSDFFLIAHHEIRGTDLGVLFSEIENVENINILGTYFLPKRGKVNTMC